MAGSKTRASIPAWVLIKDMVVGVGHRRHLRHTHIAFNRELAVSGAGSIEMTTGNPHESAHPAAFKFQAYSRDFPTRRLGLVVSVTTKRTLHALPPYSGFLEKKRQVLPTPAPKKQKITHLDCGEYECVAFFGRAVARGAFLGLSVHKTQMPRAVTAPINAFKNRDGRTNTWLTFLAWHLVLHATCPAERPPLLSTDRPRKATGPRNDHIDLTGRRKTQLIGDLRRMGFGGDLANLDDPR